MTMEQPTPEQSAAMYEVGLVVTEHGTWWYNHNRQRWEWLPAPSDSAGDEHD